MKVAQITQHEQTDVCMDGARGVRMRMLVGPKDQAPNFHMRHFEIAPGGNTPHHSHDYEHEILVLSGSGVARSEQGDRPFKAGDVIYVPPNEKHQFLNNTEQPCAFVCLIPAPRDCAR